MVFRPSLQILTLAASILSCTATFAALCYVVFTRRRSQESLRHALVINLLTAEFINSTNNSVSGVISLMHAGDLKAGSSCTANGFLGQFSVQVSLLRSFGKLAVAIDLGVLSIAISTLALVYSPTHDCKQSLLFRCIACGLVWLIGLTTSCIILGLQAFGPVSGNWCWIKEDRLALRYGLAHGWRFGVILGIIAIYICIARKLCRQYSWLRRHTYRGDFEITTGSTDAGQTTPVKREFVTPEHPLKYGPLGCAGNNIGMSEIVNVSDGPRREKSLPIPTAHVGFDGQCIATIHDHKQTQSLLELKSVQIFDTEASPQPLQPAFFEDPRIQVVVQMTAYPLLYVLLWIPGIVNRGIEASGRTSITLQYLQASTQLIGLADTIIFAIQQRNRKRIYRRT
ncbi:hypothetical protein KCU77_g1079, partial [Aureobasidium melanogenum]